MAVEDIKKLNRYKRKYKGALKTVQLLDGEELKHCISQEYNGQYYFPQWAISNMGRCYSLYQKKWLKPQAVGDDRDYWAYKGSANATVHQLVAFYFKDDNDDAAIKKFGENGVEVHHKVPINIPEELKTQTAENAEARIEHCMRTNCKTNLCYQEKQDHDDITNIANNRQTKGEKDGTKDWNKDLLLHRSLTHGSSQLEHNSSETYIRYKEDKPKEYVQTVKIGGLKIGDVAIYTKSKEEFITGKIVNIDSMNTKMFYKLELEDGSVIENIPENKIRQREK